MQCDTIGATPGTQGTSAKHAQEPQFDTVLVHERADAEDVGLGGYRAARVHAIFQLPPWYNCPELLAYIEWYTNFSAPFEPLRMSSMSYSTRHGRHNGAVIRAASI
ncbi:MAG TPA: hypothetical protein VGO47_09215 [Chlamydiales bacterium]|nr:hypothetical protein [Chlamydiales bacterium]